MSEAGFASPLFLQTLWLLPALGLVFLVARRSRTKALARFAPAERARAAIAGSLDSGRRRLRSGLVLAAVALLGLALARPCWGEHWEKVERRGADVVIALDVSRSMLADDLKPSRLERAKREIRDLVEAARVHGGGDRIGLVAFAGVASTVCPLTLDYGTFDLFLDGTSPNSVSVGGTSIAAALRQSRRALDGGEHGRGAVVLITDGEDLDGDALQAAAELAKAGVAVHTVGIGTRQGSLIPIETAQGAKSFVKDEAGKPVLSRRQDELLGKIAQTTGGQFLPASDGGLSLDPLYEQVFSPLEKTAHGEIREKHFEERFQWFLGVAMGLVAAAALVNERRRTARNKQQVQVAAGRGVAPRSTKRVGRLAASTAALGIALLVPGVASAADDPHEAVREGNRLLAAGDADKALHAYEKAQVDAPRAAEIPYDMGVAAFKKGDLERSAKELEHALTLAPTTLAARDLYNLGNARFAMGEKQEKQAPPQAIAEWKTALEAYRLSLQRDPTLQDARWNYEATDRRIRELEEQQKKQDQKDKQDQNKQDQKDKQDQNKQDQKDKQDQNKQDQKDKQDQNKQDQKDKHDENKQNQNKQDQKDRQDQSKQDQRDKQDQNKQDENKRDQSKQDQKDKQDQNKPDQNKNPGAGRTGAGTAPELSHEQAERLLRKLLDDQRTRAASRHDAAKDEENVTRDW